MINSIDSSKVRSLYLSALHTQDFDEHPLRLLIGNVFSFSKDEIENLCEDIYNSLVYLLASCEKTKSVMDLAEARRELDFTKTMRNAVRFLLISTDFIYELEKIENKNLGFLSGIAKDYFYSLKKKTDNE